MTLSSTQCFYMPFWQREKEIRTEMPGVTLVRRKDSFILNMEGQKYVGVYLPVDTAREITGQGSGAPLQVGGEYKGETKGMWVLFTNKENPELQNFERLTVLASKALTEGTGSQVSSSQVVVSGVRPVTRTAGYGIDANFAEKSD